MNIKSVAIIGAGASGLICGCLLSQNGYEVKIYERNENVGGVWLYSKEGVLYDSLVTNLPKTIMQFSDKYPFIGNSDNSFVSHKEVLNYLNSFFESNNLNKLCKFSSDVKNIEKLGKKWNVEYTYNSTDYKEYFDSVIICNGHYEEPYIPDIKNISLFKGKCIHSSKYDSHLDTEFIDKNVMVIGAGPSASDVARKIKNISNHVYVIDRSLKTNKGFKSEDNKLTQMPNIKEVTNDYEVTLETNDTITVDYIVYATGYEYKFPFLNDKYITSNDGIVRPLYQHLFNLSDPSLCFIGLPHPVIPFFMSYLQSEWVLEVFNNNSLPNLKEREKWFESFENNLKENNSFNKRYHNMLNSQFDYYRMLAKKANILTTKLELYINETELIYKENLEQMPKYPGAHDNYRSLKYKRKFL